MYICICKKITDGQIRKAVQEQDVTSIRGLRSKLGACDQCGKCAVQAQQLIYQCLQEKVVAGHNPRKAA
ncbi:(2Fe-2S)-binding protein [Methylocaldum szegediense]|uniref:Bacterioferritin-associated ferredoxin n=1 Tax=Methylocaldum szegediense TaxID=73780 RepID=A0ABM9I1Q2_9GAMM|nr:Bacterioferritin-associated ferredoxin [Methylocaldum szegediense]